MTAFLFSISFILHIITICAIYLLLKQIQQLKQDSPNDMTSLMETYLQEIKDENDQLQTALAIKPDKAHNEQDGHSETAIVKEKQLANTTTINEAFTLPEIDVKDQVESSLQAKVLQLYEQGHSSTEIAKKLNCGKTEAELIIKLHA